MDYAIWDLDNCLFDDRHRLALIDYDLPSPERYARYNAQAHLDPVRHLAQFKACPAHPIFFTGRPDETMREATRIQIRKALTIGLEPIILMRQPWECATPPALVKSRMLEELRHQLNAWDRIVAAYDDDPSIVAMYKAQGIRAHRLAINEWVGQLPRLGSGVIWGGIAKRCET